jgi:hypothetical protein
MSGGKCGVVSYVFFGLRSLTNDEDRYEQPTHESAFIAGKICFYNEKVDMYIDGELAERPKTKFG